MELKVQSFVLGPIMTNAYLIWDEETRHGVVVDPGAEPEQLISSIKDEQLTVEAILLTHAHFDHIGGVEDVRKVTGAPVYLHEQEASWLTNPTENGSAMFGEHVRAESADILLTGDEVPTFAEREVKVLHTPGHSPGSVSYYWEEAQLLVSGDVLFQGSIGRTDLPGGDYDTLMASLRRVIELPEVTRVLPGHGPGTTIEQEQMANPFISGLS